MLLCMVGYVGCYIATLQWCGSSWSDGVGWFDCLPSVWVFNTLTDEAVYRRHEISSVMSDFRQCPWEIGSAPAERAGQGEVGGCTRRVQTAWRCLGLALKSPWLEPSGPLLSSFAQMG